MAERTPSKPVSTCRSWSKSFKFRLERLKQEINKKVETFISEFAIKEVVGDYPVPTSPPRTPTPAAYAPFPEPATPPGRCARTPVGQHLHEASGSNHTSNHTSEYFDAKDGLQLEYLLQLQIPDYAECLRNRKQYGSEHSQQGYEYAQQGVEHPQYGFERPQHGFDHSQFGSELPQLGFEHPQQGFQHSQHGFQHSPLGSELSQFGSEHPQFRAEHYQHGFEHPQPGIEQLQQGFERPHPGLDEQLAGSFDDMLLNTPTASHASHPHPLDDQPFLNPVSPVSVHHHHDPPAHEYYYSGELNPSWLQPDDATGSHATSTAQQQTTTPPGYGGMSVGTGETGDSLESLMDTAGTSTMSPYILPPVAEEKPSTFYKFYVDFRRIARGHEVAFESARRGRGVRVLGKAFCYALRLRKTVVRVTKAQRKRNREPQREQRLRHQCNWKRMRTVVPTQPMTSGGSTQSTTEPRCKGISLRNGRWYSEIRVSMSTCKTKVWIGTFSSEKEAALAFDAGYYHCTEKCKEFNYPLLVNQLGDSQYQTVLALCNAGREQDARKLVRKLAAAHAAAFGAP